MTPQEIEDIEKKMKWLVGAMLEREKRERERKERETFERMFDGEHGDEVLSIADNLSKDLMK